jgi:hypothetical protein
MVKSNTGNESGSNEFVQEQEKNKRALTAPFSSEEIAEAKRRSKSQVGGRTTQEVFDRLQNLRNSSA